ncbi:MAG: BamA/TamA family outer membrane protein [Ignavibacteriaceae bacterium]
MKPYSIFVICLLISFQSASGFTNDSTLTRIVIAGKDYDADWFRRLIAGNLWRDLWITPFKASVLNLNDYADGLTPTKTGGGMQTKSLHFTGNDGRKYKFRSIDKDPSRSLPVDLRETFIAEEMQDQVPVQNPVSSVIVAPLMNAVEILNAQPELYILPDDERLGPFRDEFKDMLGTIVENPDDYYDDELNFAESDKIVSTFKLFDRLENDNDETVDAAEYLKARLFDVLIGDRDRHAGQWKWAGYKVNGKRLWKPIPEDRDFAFPLYDGFVPLIMRLAMTSIVHFDYEMPSMFDMTWEGRHLDRRLLASLTKKQWDSVAVYMMTNLGDDIIENSVREMPSELFEVRGREIIEKLKSRRNQLKQASDEFYELANMYVDIYGSNKREYVEVSRDNSNYTTVSMFKLKSDSPDKKGRLLFERTFDHSVTKEIRIHLLGGDDEIFVKGKVANGIRIIVDGGDGKDYFVDSSEVRVNLLNFLPIKTITAKTEFYDSGKKSKFIIGQSTYLNTKKWVEPDSPELKYEPVTENRFRDFSLIIPFDLSPDYGIIIGGGGAFNFYDFRVEPYSHRLSFTTSYSTRTRRFEFIGEGDFYKLVEGINVNLYAQLTGLELNRFYGFGNENEFSDSLEDAGIYDIEQSKFYARSLFSFPVFQNTTFSLGLAFERSVLSEVDGSLINELKTATGTHSSVTFLSKIQYDSRDDTSSPYNGQTLEVSVEQSPSFLNFNNKFGKLYFDGRTYFTSYLVSRETFAMKLAAQYVWGDFPIHEYALIGGKSTLRGLPRNIFLGDISVSLQTDIRILVGKFKIFIPAEFGVTAINDFGRVFYKNESSKKWHSAHGGGIWLSVLDRFFTAGMNVVKSAIDLRFYLSIGHTF